MRELALRFDKLHYLGVMIMVMVLSDTFNNILVISWRSVLLMEETGVPRENKSTCRKSLKNYITLCFIEYTLPSSAMH